MSVIGLNLWHTYFSILGLITNSVLKEHTHLCSQKHVNTLVFDPYLEIALGQTGLLEFCVVIVVEFKLTS